MLVKAAEPVVRAAGDTGWFIMWMVRDKGYEETLGELVRLEEVMKEEARKARGAQGGNTGGRKKGDRRQ